MCPSLSNHTITKLFKNRILVIDGAMGTMVQKYNLDEASYKGKLFANHTCDLKGNNDVLSLTQPNIIKEIHSAYLDAGADIIETNTFSANAISMADYQLEDSVYDLNVVSARIAKEVAVKFSSQIPGKPRFVAGSLGPTNRTASISPNVNDPGYRSVTFDQLVAAYTEQVRGLIDGGVDLLLVETVFDTLNCKAALFAIDSYFEDIGKKVPVMISGTITDASGRTLSGQTTEAFWTSIAHANPLVVGLNCALGARDMRPFLEDLSGIASCFISCYPNAGLPNELGEYTQSPDEMAGYLKNFAQSSLVNIVGGCCGTTPDHIRAIVRAVSDFSPRPLKDVPIQSSFSGLEPLVVRTDSNFINVGERTNVMGSRKFAELIQKEDYETALSVAREQVEAGAQIIDINMDDPLLESEKVMAKFLNLVASEPDISRVPIMIDSSKWSVIEAGLKCVQGKTVVNSLSLKEGEDVFKEQAKKVRQYGAAVIVMAFDEKGQADTLERRVEICTRAYKILTEEAGFPPQDIILDPNIFAVATGIKEHNNYAKDYFEATRIIKKTLPHCLVSGGVSNVSFSFRGNSAVRSAMHSVFLYHAIGAGMDMGIVNAGMIDVYEDIPKDLLKLVEDVLLNSSEDATEKLVAFAENVKSEAPQKIKESGWRKKSLEEKISHALVKGLVEFIDEDVEAARKKLGKALKVIEGPLMDGMNKVGELFGQGKMFLPQVVKSARVMKKAVDVLAPYVKAEKKRSDSSYFAGKILMATVKGDVHDIGKNIVGVVLACNNFEIVDIGVMVTCENILKAARQENVDIICLSGLITPSLDEMVHVASEMERQGFDIPLLVGGATTSKEHCALKIDPVYHGLVVHVKDAALSVAISRNLMKPEIKSRTANDTKDEYKKLREKYAQKQKTQQILPLEDARRRRFFIDWKSAVITKPSFLGIKVFSGFSLDEIKVKIDWSSLFTTWELKGRYPEILDDPNLGREANKIFNDAKEILSEIIEKRLLTANAVLGFFPANSMDDDIEVYKDDTRREVLSTFSSLRQQVSQNGDCCYALSDFIAPKDTGIKDYMGFFALTTGLGVKELVAKLKKDRDDYKAIMIESLADRLVEAFSELMHEKARKSLWGYIPEENLTNEEEFKCKYQGIRPALGYPIFPDHSQKDVLFKLLDVKKNTCIELTENYGMIPVATVCGFYIAHPQSRYFWLGKIGKDQMVDLAQRSNKKFKEMEKWLGPYLGY